MELLGLTLQTLGELVIGLLVIRVHHRILKDRKIDGPVFQDIRVEQVAGAFGLALVAIGYAVRVIQLV
jgi:hypothetical protein